MASSICCKPFENLCNLASVLLALFLSQPRGEKRLQGWQTLSPGPCEEPCCCTHPQCSLNSMGKCRGRAWLQRWEPNLTPECLFYIPLQKAHIDPDSESECKNIRGGKGQFLTTGNSASVCLVHYQLCVILNTDLEFTDALIWCFPALLFKIIYFLKKGMMCILDVFNLLRS